MKIEDAIIYATKKHTNQTRRDGSPYIFHPIYVCNLLKDQGYPIEYQIAGLFHDLLEDTDAIEEEILNLSDEAVLTAVKLLTKTADKSKNEYINDILLNPIAKAVKNADRIHNLTEALTADKKFIDAYLKNTKKYYYGNFSNELDAAYDRLENYYNQHQIVDAPNEFPDPYYTIDSSILNSAVYKTYKDGSSYVYSTKDSIWIPCDPFFWASMNDNALNISEEEAMKLIEKP